MISVAYNLSSIVGLVITTIYGSQLHRPRLLGLGGLLVGLGAFVNTLPQWLSENYEKTDAIPLICTESQDVTDVEDCEYSESGLFGWIIFGEVLMGFGFSGFMTLGMSYLHDISPDSDRAYNQAVLMTLFLFGPFLSMGIIYPFGEFFQV